MHYLKLNLKVTEMVLLKCIQHLLIQVVIVEEFSLWISVTQKSSNIRFYFTTCTRETDIYE